MSTARRRSAILMPSRAAAFMSSPEIGALLAKGRPLRLVNLGPRSLFEKSDPLDRFEGALRMSPARRFVRETWEEFMAGMASHDALPTWLDSWLTAREVYVGSHALGSP